MSSPSRRRYADLAGWIRLLSPQDPELDYPRGITLGGTRLDGGGASVAGLDCPVRNPASRAGSAVPVALVA